MMVLKHSLKQRSILWGQLLTLQTIAVLQNTLPLHHRVAAVCDTSCISHHSAKNRSLAPAAMGLVCMLMKTF